MRGKEKIRNSKSFQLISRSSGPKRSLTVHNYYLNIGEKTTKGFYTKRKEVLMRATPIYSLSAELGANTIDPDKLNCRVRNGNGCDLVGINITLIKTS